MKRKFLRFKVPLFITFIKLLKKKQGKGIGIFNSFEEGCNIEDLKYEKSQILINDNKLLSSFIDNKIS